MVLLNILWVVNWIALCSAAASEDDQGLAVSLSPSFFYYGGMNVFQGKVNTFTTDKYYVPKYHSFYDDTDIVSMRSDPDKNRMIYIDSLTQSVRKIRYFNSWLNDSSIDHQNTIHQGLSDTLHARLAFDWLTGNAYWTDNKMNWIAVQNVDHTDQSAYKILIHAGIVAPAALAVDPINRYLFWAEHGADRTVIVRSDLTGQNQKIIVKGLDWVPDMMADTDSKMIYWIDNNRNAIERSNYNGESRKIVYRSTNILLAISAMTLYKNVLCVTEYADEFVACVDKETGIQTWADYVYDGYPFAMDMYSMATRPQTNHDCQNYGCSDICINTNSGAKCFCREGYELDTNDNKNCKASHSLYGQTLLIANETDICMYDLRVITSHDGNDTCFYQPSNKIGRMTVDANNAMLYYEDATTRSIMRLDLKTFENISWVATGQVSGLQYDWVGENIYWTESDSGVLRVASATIRDRVSTELTNLVNPRELTVYPHEYLLFWIAGNSGSNIIQSYTVDGSKNVKTILDHANVQNPVTLSYQPFNLNMLFYIDNGVLQSVEKDGKSKTTYQAVGADKYLLLYQDFSITTSGTERISVVNVHNTASKSTVDVSAYGTILSMGIVDAKSQRKEKNGCENKNGGCQHICIPETNNNHKCECSFGYQLSSDGKTCTVNTKKSNFALAVDFTHGEIYQVDINDGKDVNAIDIPRPAYPVAAIFDDKDHIYWVDYASDKIHRSNLTGGNTSTIYTMNQYLCFSLAMDPSTGNVYYAAVPYGSDPNSYLGVIEPKKLKHKTLVEKIEVAASIALYPKKGIMFWIDQSYYLNFGSIHRASMDGTDTKIIIPSGLSQPNSIAIDYTADRLYWADFYENAIYTAALDGSDRRRIFTDTNANMAHLAVAGSYVYYTATKRERITKIDTNIEKAQVWMNNEPEMGRLESLDVYTTTTIPTHASCSKMNGLCSTFCFPKTEYLIACGCEDGKELMADDMRTCQGVLRCNKSIPNGKFDDTCMPYDGSLCGYSCNDGYSKTADVKLKCGKHANVPNKLEWNRDVKPLCRKDVVPPTTTPIPKTPQPTPRPTPPPTQGPGVTLGQKQPDTTVTEGVPTATFIGVLFAVIILFILIILGVAFVLYRRRGSDMFTHAKFVNAPNVPHLTDINAGRENTYEHIDEKVATAQNVSNTAAASTDGMENPLYKATTTSSNSPEAMNQNAYTTIEISKF